jgi:hypothetical protein
MLRPNYTMWQQGDAIIAHWSSPHLGQWALAPAVVMAAAALGLLFFHHPLRERLGAGGRIARPGLWIAAAGTALALAGALLATLTRPPTTLVRWELTPRHVLLEGMSGRVEMGWETVASARLERQRGAETEDSSLVLTDRDGREGWLVLKWLVKPHRREWVNRITRLAPEAMKPVAEDAAYREALSS